MKFRFIDQIQNLIKKSLVVEVLNLTDEEQKELVSMLFPYIINDTESSYSNLKLDASNILGGNFFEKLNQIKVFVRNSLYDQLEKEGWLRIHASAIKSDAVTLFVGDSKVGKSSSAFLTSSLTKASFVANDDIYLHPTVPVAIGYPAGFGVPKYVGNILGIEKNCHIFSENSYWYTNEDMLNMNYKIEYGGEIKRIVFPNFTKKAETITSVEKLDYEKFRQKIFDCSKVSGFDKSLYQYLSKIPGYSITTAGVCTEYCKALRSLNDKTFTHQQNIYKNLGINYYFGFNDDLAHRFQEVKKSGFEYISINADTYSEENYNGLENIIIEALKAGLKIAYVHAPYCKEYSIRYFFENGPQTEQIMNFHKYAVGLCEKYKIPVYVMHANRKNDSPPLGNVCLKNFSELNDISKQNNVKLAIENITSLQVLKFLLSNIQDENFGLCYDSGHDNLYTKNPAMLDFAKGRVFTVHLHDNFGDKDSHNAIGDGNINWSLIFNKLQSAHYRGPWMLEVKNPEKFVSEQEFLSENFKRLKNTLEKTGVLSDEQNKNL